MLFALFGKRMKPRRFIYTPRYYDPEKEKDRAERMRFDNREWSRKHAKTGPNVNPLFLLALAVVVAGLIYALRVGQPTHVKVSDITLTPSDVPAQTATPQGAK